MVCSLTLEERSDIAEWSNAERQRTNRDSYTTSMKRKETAGGSLQRTHKAYHEKKKMIVSI